jgi:hypothetical protein
MNTNFLSFLFVLSCFFLGIFLGEPFVEYTGYPLLIWIIIRIWAPDLLWAPQKRYAEEFKKFDEGWTPEELAEAAASGKIVMGAGTILSKIAGLGGPLFGGTVKLLFITRSYSEKLKDFQRIHKKWRKYNGKQTINGRDSDAPMIASPQKSGPPPFSPPQKSGPPPAPPRMKKGIWADDGYEWIEYPEGQDEWYWRDQSTGEWVRHEG